MRKLDKEEINNHISNISKSGYSIIEQFLSDEEVDKALKISKINWEESCNLEKDHCKTAKIVYGLETKDKFFLDLLIILLHVFYSFLNML